MPTAVERQPGRSTQTYRDWAGRFLWVGENKNRGIGVFPKNAHTVVELPWNGDFGVRGLASSSPCLRWSTENLRLFLPFTIDGEIDVVGVWTKGSEDQVFGYMGQFWKYLQIHRHEMADGDQIVLGDFNSNTIWDKRDRWWNHSDVVSELKAIGIESLYHRQFKEKQGCETIPTFFLYRNPEKPFHIDYVFVSKRFMNGKIKIGAATDWLPYSDHVPIVIDLPI